MVHGHVKPQRARIADTLGWAIDALGTADVDVVELDGAIIVADCDAGLGAALV
jgi:hypothetical protein